MKQIHKSNVEIVTSEKSRIIDDCDAIITNKKDTPLMVLIADCVPILIEDSKKGVIGAVHAGRASTFENIVQKTILEMVNNFDCKVEDISVQMGPSIQKCCYEVSVDIANITKEAFGEEFVKNRYIDLQMINKKQLLDIGVENIKVSEICTKCNSDEYFSYRKNKNNGRFAGIIKMTSF